MTFAATRSYPVDVEPDVVELGLVVVVDVSLLMSVTYLALMTGTVFDPPMAVV